MYSWRHQLFIKSPYPRQQELPVPLKTILQWALLSRGDDVTVSKTCRSAINKHGYPWSSLRPGPVRVTILPGCSPGSWETEYCQFRCYLSLALACLAAANGTLLDHPPGDSKAPFCQPQVAFRATPSSPMPPLSSLLVNAWLFHLFLLPLLHVLLKAKTQTQAFMYIRIGL